MNLKGLFGKAEKLAKEHPDQVDKAIDLTSGEIKKYAPDSVDKTVDSAAKKAKEEI